MTITTFEDAQAHPLWAAQLQLEEEMRSMGIDRFRKSNEAAVENGKETRVGPVNRLVGDVHVQMCAAVEGFFRECEAKKAGRKHTAYPFLKKLGDIDAIAHMTIRMILDAVSQDRTLTHHANAIASAVEAELNFREFKEQNIAGYLGTMKHLRKKSNERVRTTSGLQKAAKLGVELTEWTMRDRVLVGSKLVELFITSTNLVRLKRTPDRISIEMEPLAREWIEKECSRSEWLTPVYVPTVIPPRPWTSPMDGGYWTGRARKLTLVKTPNRAYLAELAERDMPIVYGSINALQDTAWTINKRVLAVIEELWATSTTLDVIPSSDNLPEPAKPYWLTPEMRMADMTEAQSTEFLNWKSEARAIHEENGQLVSKRMSFSRMLWVARKYAGMEMFFPHQLDWRGRAYPVPLYLQPQGNDAQKGLLELATTAPIHNQDAADWLAIHGAGCWGIDKCSFAERVEWVGNNEQAILASAADPLNNTFWADAEKPFMALAFCFEWAGFRSEGFGFESCLQVQMDGTCNGLQNFSALLRDAIGGAAVNLVPSDKPQDIYQRVADLVSAQVEKDLFSAEFAQVTKSTIDPVTGKKTKQVVNGTAIAEFARGWHGKVTRKVCKRPVMTLAYGARKFGFAQQVFEDTMKPWKQEAGLAFPFQHSGWDAAQYMAALIWKMVGTVVVAAREAMDWLQAAARVVSKEGSPIHWAAPSGLLVQQAYRLREMQDVELAFETVRLRLKIGTDTEKLDSARQSNGIAPNWIHSLDASHQARTIVAAVEAGITAFSFIHDSYGTHAGNCSALAAILREEFVVMYSETDVLRDFRDQIATVLGDAEALPELPAMGTLDLSQVLDSRFFFA